ncbi:alpha/beta fold hydrolase [Actinokineospora iranica]|uniref:Lysophospholipase, alpha-beta hydrolase superfamily n=1 Tax=Actinokineospora iranica TaxID=1271860 RepID=A0A1G6YSH9_9PSEU|nr:alpha/beta hydrolase [Actinokineospora iranica]SDD93261.1 Lysophospholipase, alpha-beta hydrolase superfamily [Actinokineospora iranica]
MIEVRGIRTHYQRMPAKNPRSASPPVVVFVHGLGYDSLASFYLTLAAPFAEAGMEVFTYDLRAHGRTERPATGYRLSDFVDDLTELLDLNGIHQPVHLVGNSFGGTIAFSFAARHPGRVRSIVSIEAEPATEPWAEKMGRTLEIVVAEMDNEENLRWLAETFGSHHARLAKAAAAMIRATSIVEEVPQGPLLSSAELASITCPVLSILGSEGFQSDDLTAVESLLPDCRTEVIDGQNHSVLVERHRTVRDMVLGWVNALHDRAAA